MIATQPFSSHVGANSNVIPAEDMLNGASAIAQFLGWTRRRLYYEADADRVRKTYLPVFRIGATLSARKSSLLRWIADQEAAALLGTQS